MAKVKPIEINLTTARIAELREAGEIKCGLTEFRVLLDLALETMAKETAIDHNVEALRTSLAEETSRLEKVARHYSEANQALARSKRDLAHADNYAQSLARRLQDAVGKEHTIREWQIEFELSVQKCIDRQQLGPVASLNATLLRLQEALESAIHEAPPAK